MIEINLLPEKMRRKEKKEYFKFDLELGKVKFVAGGVFVGLLVLLLVIFSLGSYIRRRQVMNLLSKEKSFAVEKLQVESLNNEIVVLKNKLGTLGDMTQRRFLWAKKLNELSDLVLPGTWFTHIHTAPEDMLILEGSVISKKEEAMGLVGRLIKNIREHESFFKDFSNIKLESVQRKTIDARDVVDFRIALYFK